MDNYQFQINFVRNCTKFFNPYEHFILDDEDIVYCTNVFLNSFVEFLKRNSRKHIKIVCLSSTYNMEFYITKENYEFLLEHVDQIVSEQNSLPDHPKLFKCMCLYFNDMYLFNNHERLCNKPKNDEIFTSHSVASNPQMRMFYTSSLPTSMSLEKFYEEMASNKYVLCPSADGIFTNRLFEAIVCGCIPITQLPKNFVTRFSHCNLINLPGYTSFQISSPVNFYETKSDFIKFEQSVSNSLDMFLMPEEWRNYKMSVEEAKQKINTNKRNLNDIHNAVFCIEPWLC